MEFILNLFKTEADLREERIAKWKADEPRMAARLERAMRKYGICSKEANAISKEMDRREAEAYAFHA